MKSFASPSVVSIGEAMLEMAPTGLGLFRQGYAGDTFNTVWHMAQLLRDRAATGFVTRVGSDTLSDRFLAEMVGDGLSVSCVMRDAEKKMGLYLIELDGVERSFHYWRGDSAARRLADDPAMLTEVLRGAGLIHLSGITLAILSPEARRSLFSVLADVRSAGSVISFDPNVRPRLWSSPEETRDTISEMLAMTDIALPSFDDEAALWGDCSPVETVARMRSHGIGEVVVKNGSCEVVYGVGGETGMEPTPKVEIICDTTGAGDSFNAGYLSARLVGCSVLTSLRAGQRTSAEVIGHFGARAPKTRIREIASVILAEATIARV